MQFKSSNHEEISRYYKGTFIKLREFGDQLFAITGVNSESVTGQMPDGNDFILHLSDEVPYEVDYLLPHKSFFQNGKNAVLLQRVPARQYRRGVCSDNTRMTELSNTGNTRNLSVNFATLQAYVQKSTFPSMADAIANKKRWKSVALSKRVAYVSDMMTFFVDLRPVARWDTDKVVMLNKLFTDELTKLATPSNFKVV